MMPVTFNSIWKVGIATASIGIGVVIAVLVQATPAKSRTSPTSQVDLPTTVFASGRVEGASQEIELRAPVAGRITEVLVKQGQLVSQGDLLLQVEDSHILREVDRVAAGLALAEAQLQKVAQGPTPQQLQEVRSLHQARIATRQRELSTWKRIEELLKSGTITPQEADDQRARLDAAVAEAAAVEARLADLESRPRPEDLKIAHAQVASARAALEAAQANHARTQVRAPIAGRVLEINARGGEVVGPESRSPALILADTTTYRVRAFVDEIDAPNLELGMPVVIRADGLGDSVIEGTVAELAHRMQSKQIYQNRPTERLDTKTREVWIDVTSEAQKLIVGLRVDVYISPLASR